MQTGPQELAFAGLRAVSYQGQINAVQTDALGNLYLLIDQKDGVRLLKTDAAGANVLAQAQIGAPGDIGLAMALDPAGNLYVTGTTTSGALTATAGAAFVTQSGTSTNSFVAKFDSNLNTVFVTFAGGGLMAADSIAATSDAVFITGSIFAATLPVTPAGIIQAPAFGSSQNGFVERFSASGGTLQYATYLSGTNGSTTPAAIAADGSDNAYIAGNTTSAGYPTVAALVPAMIVSGSAGAASGFLTKLTPAGDGITFSTYIPGTGITSLAIDATAANLLLSGSVALGQFPVASVSVPLTATEYQILLRMPMGGSSVLGSTVIAPGSQSFVTAGASGTAWVDGPLSLPLMPLTPLSSIGNSFAVRVNGANAVDQTARFGGIAASNPGNAGAPVALTSVAVDASGEGIFGGGFAPYASQSLLATQTFDLPLENAPTPAFPSTVRSAVLPASACNGSLCPGSAAFLAKLAVTASAAAASASLALSVDDSPNLTLRNLGSVDATGVAIAVSGFTFATNCGSTLPAGGECSIALAGSGPGSITAQGANATTQTAALPAIAVGVAQAAVVVSPKELDFGIVSSASGVVERTITVTNLTSQSQTFTSALNGSAKTTLPYSLVEAASDCALSGTSSAKFLAPGTSCHITIGLTASNASANDGAIQQNWLVGGRDVLLTAYGQAAALSLSVGEVDFGTQFVGGLRLPRYLYLSNNSTTAAAHTAVTLPVTSPFSVTDRCAALLEPLSVCQLQLTYKTAAVASADAVTLLLDQSLTVLVTGRSLPQPSLSGASVNPNLNLSATSLTFANAVVVTGISTTTQTLTIGNTGASAFALTLPLTGDFIASTNCGTTLAGGSSCSVVLNFAPSQPGMRQGLLAVTAGVGTSPAYVTLNGIGTGIISPGNNGTLDFGGVAVGQPSVQWYKITQPFTDLAVVTTPASGTPFTAVLVEDIGYGHGQLPSSDFGASEEGSCLNCWLGVQFTPTATGQQTGTLTLASTVSGSPYVLSLTGEGLPLSGLLLTPVTQDFGPVTIHSTSGSSLFTLTNLVAGGGPVSIAAPLLTGDFSISGAASGGAACGGVLAYSASCFVEVAYAPTVVGPETGTLTLQSASASVTAALTGYGSPDPGISLNPASLTFGNVPGSASTLQTVTLTNTGGATEQIGIVAASTNGATPSNFSAITGCGALAAGASCSISVTFTPGSGPVAGTLTIPVTSSVGGAPFVTLLSVPLTGAYSTAISGLQIVPGDTEYGPQASGATGETRQFTLNNLTPKSLLLNVTVPRQFVLSGPPCVGLAPNASCNFFLSFLPITGGDITGTLFAQGAPTDGSATLDGQGYVEGFGIGSGALSVTGALLPGALLQFAQTPSGQTTQQTLTLTNASSVQPLTIRRITSGWPFLSTSTCGATLAPAQSCAVTLTYSPLNQVASGASSPPSLADMGTLTIESDAASSPDLIDLSGSATPVSVASPSDAAPLTAFTPSQGSLTFAGTAVGNVSASQSVTLNNTGSATLTILGLQTSADFTASSNCTVLVAGASCTVTVAFTPQNTSQAGTGAGTRAGALEISSNASTSLEFVSLAGVAGAPALTLSPASLDFGAQMVGTSAMQSVQIGNPGAGAVTFGTVGVTGDYSVLNGTCPAPGGTLAAGASCSVQVSFLPLDTGGLTGTLSIASSATTLPLTVPLTGTGVQSHLQISPASLSFGSIGVGASQTQSFTLANTGTTAITKVGTAISLGAADYAITGSCAVATLAADGSCSVMVTFSPAAVGARPGTLTVTSSDISSPAAVPLTGTGAAGGSFALKVNGGSSASVTVSSGSGTPASYGLTVTPAGGFGGTVVLNCTPVVAATWASCSILPSSVTLAGVVQNSTATVTTVTSVTSASVISPDTPRHSSRRDTEICLLLPALIFAWKARASSRRQWRGAGPVAWAIFLSIALLSSGGCGGGAAPNTSNPGLRYVAPGTYRYQVTASSTNGTGPITQTVTLNLTVQ